MVRLNRKWGTLSRSLGIRIGLSVALILLASYSLFVFLVIDMQRNFYIGQMVREAERFSSGVINATHHSMLLDDSEATRNIIKDIAREKDISDIRIYNHDGMIKFSNQPAEVGTTVNKRAEACFACHSEDKPFSEVVTSTRTRIHDHGGHRVLGMITPIYNRKSCSMAPCHVHPQEQKVLGVLDMGMSLANLDSQVESLVKKTVLLGLATLAAVLGTIGLYITFRVHKPVTQLRDAAMKLALGDYSHKLDIPKGDQVGECAWAFNMMRDQVRRRTQELARSREEFKRLFDQVPCFICVIDRNFNIMRQNASMRELFRGSIGMHCYEVFKKRSVKCEECHADLTLTYGQASGGEHCGLKGTGEEANYVSYTSPILDDKGNVLYAMIIAVDVGERVKLEKELEASKDFQTNLIENSIHGIVATDEHGRINIYNRAAENLLGYRTQDALGDTDLAKYFPPQFVDTIVASHLGKEIDGARTIAQETAVTAADGESVPVRFSGFILSDREATAGAVGFFQDLRMFKQLEREKLASDRLAVVGQTVAGLAHGIKNILTGLEGGVFVVDTAMEDEDDDLLHRGWKTVRNNIGRISGLVKDLLGYSKDRTPQYEETDPNLLAEEVCALFETRAREKSIVIERDFDPLAGKTFKIFMDQRGIHTCLSNLVANAIDACETDEKEGQHRVVVGTFQDSDGDVVYQVSDNGSGMTEETKHRLFASFYSTKGSRGTGLGLLVTSKIVAEHGGQISFESEAGVGSTFIIRLPPGARDASDLLASDRERLDRNHGTGRQTVELHGKDVPAT